MKISQLINSFTGRLRHPEQTLNSDDIIGSSPNYNKGDIAMDILGQNAFRLAYPTFSLQGAHSEEYSIALQVAEEFNTLVDYKERMEFWDAHYSVFGLASIVVFDTEKKIYGGHHGYPQGKLTYGLEGDEGRFRAFFILPSDIEDILPFMFWCLGKRRNRVEVNTIMDEAYYWKRINKDRLPGEFLTNLLTAAEAHRNHIDEIQNPWATNLFTDGAAKDCLFFYGNQDASRGEVDGIFGSQARLYQVYKNIITCPLSTYGEIFFQYDDGFHTALMVAFLRKEKKRLDRGEVISLPAKEPNSVTEEKVNLSETNESPNMSYPPKYQNFLNEVATIENGFGNYGTRINPTFYTPVATLWEQLGDEDIQKARDLYRSEVKEQVNFASQVSNVLLKEYQTAVKMQPDKQKELLIEHRDKYVNLLSEKYTPIKDWYIEFKDEASQTDERINQLESEVFYFCYQNNKPFMVGRTLLQMLYGYRLTIDRLNNQLPPDVQAQPLSKNEKPKRINTEAQEKYERIYKKYDGYIKDKYTHSGAIQALLHDFRLEYNPTDSKNRKKTLQAIIRKRNNKE